MFTLENIAILYAASITVVIAWNFLKTHMLMQNKIEYVTQDVRDLTQGVYNNIESNQKELQDQIQKNYETLARDIDDLQMLVMRECKAMANELND